MRICLATPLYPPELGGPATYTKILEESFPGEGIEVAIVPFSTVRRYPRFVRHILYYAKLRAQAKTADVILVLDPISTGLPALFAARALEKPLVLKVVGDYAWEQGRQRFGVTQTLDEFIETPSQPSMVRLLRRMESYVARHATKVLVPSEYLKKVVISWGVSKESITVIYNAVTPVSSGSVSEEVAALSRPRIVTVGRLVSWKGVHALLDIVAKLRVEFPTLSLVVAGEGPEQERLTQHAKDLLKTGYVYTGSVSNDSVQALLQDADVFALNTSYEGFSHVIIEALYAGTPIVTTPVGGTPEILENGVNAVLCAPDAVSEWVAAITSVLRDEQYRNKLVEGAKETSEKFSREHMVRVTADFLKTSI